MTRLTATQRKAQDRRSTGWCKTLGAPERKAKGCARAARLHAIMARLPDPPARPCRDEWKFAQPVKPRG